MGQGIYTCIFMHKYIYIGTYTYTTTTTFAYIIYDKYLLWNFFSLITINTCLLFISLLSYSSLQTGNIFYFIVCYLFLMVYLNFT